MKKLTIKLKQHTPLIHFQNYKSGTMNIRGSEIRPRLDKYLWATLESIQDSWKVSSDHGALNYSLKIKALQKMKSIQIEKDDKKWAPFFGNMGDDYDNNKKYIVYPENFNSDALEVEIKSPVDDLIEEIQMHISNFFLTYNFMTRSSKGFGSFSVTKINEERITSIPNSNYFTIGKTNNTIAEISKMFAVVDLFYKSIRAGINKKGKNQIPVYYFKSCLYMYLNAKGIQWDKKTIKSKFLNNQQKKECAMYNDDIVCNPNQRPENESVYKPFLGLSSSETWKSESTTLKSKVKVNQHEFTRTPSFITLKPIFYNGSFRIYILEDYSRLQVYPANVKFDFEWNNQNLTLSLGDPSVMQGYMKWIYKNIDGSHGDVLDPSGERDHKTLENIFSQLQKNNPYA